MTFVITYVSQIIFYFHLFICPNCDVRHYSISANAGCMIDAATGRGRQIEYGIEYLGKVSEILRAISSTPSPSCFCLRMPTEVFERHPKLWFSDGSVILLAIRKPQPEPVERHIEDNMSDSDSDELNQSDMDMDKRGGDETEVESIPEEKLQNILFKVHKSILAKSSLMFADMFASPALRSDKIPASVVENLLSEDEEAYDELPFIIMNDAFEDVESLLTTIYDPS